MTPNYNVRRNEHLHLQFERVGARSCVVIPFLLRVAIGRYLVKPKGKVRGTLIYKDPEPLGRVMYRAYAWEESVHIYDLVVECADTR